MTDQSTAYHEAAHAVAAQSLGLPVTYLTIRPHPDSAGRTKFDTDTEGFQKLDDSSARSSRSPARSVHGWRPTT